MTQTTEWHVLGLSGGRDSAALAVHMRQNHPELDLDYFFTDTGKELPEVYEFLGKLEGFLGKPILRLNPDRDFDFWLRQYNDFLPSAQSRWCTRQLKLRPFEHWIRPALQNGRKVFSYVAIRADENYREGYSSRHENLSVRLPLREAGIDKAGVMELLEGVGLGLPAYYEWRSRSGLYVLLLPTEDRMGQTPGTASRCLRGGPRLREDRCRTRIALYLEPGGVPRRPAPARTHRADQARSRAPDRSSPSPSPDTTEPATARAGTNRHGRAVRLHENVPRMPQVTTEVDNRTFVRTRDSAEATRLRRA